MKWNVGRPFPSGGGSEKSCLLKTTAVNSDQVDLTYTAERYNTWWFCRKKKKKNLFIEDLKVNREKQT